MVTGYNPFCVVQEGADGLSDQALRKDRIMSLERVYNALVPFNAVEAAVRLSTVAMNAHYHKRE